MFNAINFYTDTVSALRAGSKAVLSLLKLNPEQLAEVADVATAKAATKSGYADVRLLLARVSWHASEMRKADKAPAYILRSRTAKGVTTVYATPYTYNENKATKTVSAASAASAKPAKPATDESNTDSDGSSMPDANTVIAALQSELSMVRAELDAERTAHETTRAELASARAMLAGVAATPRKPATRTARTANA